MNTQEVSVHILHAGVGPVTKNDIALAKASEALIIGFGIPEDPAIIQFAKSELLSIKYYKIIYEIIEDLIKVAEGMYNIEMEEIELGKAEVRNLFKFSKVGIIAGSHILEGKILRNSIARVFREGTEIFEGKINSLKRFKDDVKEVSSGYECGIVLDGFDALKEKDIIMSYKLQEKKRSL